MPAIYHEGSWLGNATDPEVLVKDTVGWTGKNRAYSQTNNAVIAHIENGITYDVSWTGSATVTLKKNSASGATITSGSTSPLSFTADADYELYFGSSATVTNIMVKDSRITDPTYEPYHESVEVMYEEEIHGVNLADSSMANIGIAWNGATNSDRARLVIPCSPNTEYIASINGTNAMSYIGYVTSPTIIPSQTSLIDFVSPASITTGANDRYIIIGFAKTGITQANVDALKFMLRKATIDDPTYRPYNYQAIQNQLNDKGALGAKNLVKVTANTQTINGVTFTVNADKSVAVNGTATAEASLTVMPSNNENVPRNVSLILSGCPSGGDVQKYGLYTRIGLLPNNTYVRNDVDYGEGSAPFIVTDNNTIYVQIIIRSGQTVNNLTFKPMLRLASDPDDTYQPYAMTNRELTEKKINIADLKTVVSASSDFTDFKTRIASL